MKIYLFCFFSVVIIILFFFSSCNKVDEKNFCTPQVYTLQPVKISDSQAVFRANCILDKKKFELVFEWKKVSENGLSTVKQNATHGVCSFPIENLEEDTEYTVRALMIDIHGDTLYGENIGFRTHGTMQDIDGNTYLTMRYGNKVFMTENLRVTRYSDGTKLVARSGVVNNFTDGPAYYYSSAHSVFLKNPNYGLLYNWAAALRVEDCQTSPPSGSNTTIQGICPEGWHIPSISEYGEITYHYRGYQMKTENWSLDSKYTINNYSQFSAEPSGFYHVDSGEIDKCFNMVGRGTLFMSRNQGDEYMVYTILLLYREKDINVYPTFKSIGVSVRCVKD